MDRPRPISSGEVMRWNEDVNHCRLAHGTGFGLGFAVAAMMFADGEKMKRQMQEMEEERPYLEEINRIDAQFDREIIRMSGFGMVSSKNK